MGVAELVVVVVGSSPGTAVVGGTVVVVVVADGKVVVAATVAVGSNPARPSSTRSSMKSFCGSNHTTTNTATATATIPPAVASLRCFRIQLIMSKFSSYLVLD